MENKKILERIAAEEKSIMKSGRATLIGFKAGSTEGMVAQVDGHGSWI